MTKTSFKPPMVAVGIKQDSHPYGVVKAAGAFAINALGADQRDIAQTFFGTVKPEGDHLGPVTFKAGTTGAPVIKESPAYWECRVVGVLEQGDHHVFLGEVVEAGVNNETPTLLMRDTGWNYGGYSNPEALPGLCKGMARRVYAQQPVATAPLDPAQRRRSDV